MSEQMTDNTINLINKLDDMPARPIETLLSKFEYDPKDVANAADLITKML